ncbi:MAG TPA: response regulator transcription factor [Terriglobales bacterium]|nr:response regulator transcription factor [Terriglobales bacterium]
MLIRAIIADDHEEFRRRIYSELAPQFDVVAVVESGEEALREVKRLRPDVAVLDLNMGPLNGIDVIRTLVAEQTPVAIVVVSADADPLSAQAALSSGAAAFVVKSRLSDDLKTAIERALRRVSFVSPGVLDGAPHSDRR